MAAGILAFMAIIIFVKQGEDASARDSELAGILGLALLVFALLALGAWVFARSKTRAALKQRLEEAKQELEEGAIPKELMIGSIFGAAGAEGIGLFGVVGYLLTSATSFLVAPVQAIIVILVCIPRRAWAQGVLESLGKDF